MTIRRTEHPNFTSEQVRQAVVEAVAIADSCGLIPEDRAALLPGILGNLTSKQVVLEEIGQLPNMVVPRGMG
jgi:hypothetical protein